MKNIWVSKKNNIKWIFLVAIICIVTGVSIDNPRLVPVKIKIGVGVLFLVYGILCLIFRPKEVE